MRRVLAIGACVLLLLATVGVTAYVVLRDDGSAEADLAAAVELAPKETLQFSWTDWAGIRAELDESPAPDAPRSEVQRFLDHGWEADLTSTSTLVAEGATLHERFGFSPANLEWELFAQSEEGALLVMGLPASLEASEVEDALTEAGYVGEGGSWSITEALLAQLEVTPQLAHLKVDTEHHVLLASDQSDYLAAWPDNQRGSLDDPITSAVDTLGDPLTATFAPGEHACATVSMTQADEVDRVRGEELVEEAGGVFPYRSYALGLLPDGTMRAVMVFDNADQARANADSRARLAAGPAPGQGGSFGERFAVPEGGVTADGAVVRMDLEPVADFPFSDLTSGPVLFASC